MIPIYKNINETIILKKVFIFILFFRCWSCWNSVHVSKVLISIFKTLRYVNYNFYNKFLTLWRGILSNKDRGKQEHAKNKICMLPHLELWCILKVSNDRIKNISYQREGPQKTIKVMKCWPWSLSNIKTSTLSQIIHANILYQEIK